MWYPEEPITYCQRCEDDISVDYVWRGTGVIIGQGGKRVRTMVLYSICPGCGTRLSVGLDGPWWYRLIYAFFWRQRYPNTERPYLASREALDEESKRRRCEDERRKEKTNAYR